MEDIFVTKKGSREREEEPDWEDTSKRMSGLWL